MTETAKHPGAAMPSASDFKLSFPAEEAAHVTASYKAAQVILEYGSGGSTVLAARMPGKLVFSVESDRDWAIRLQQALDRSELPSSAIIYPIDIGPTGAWGRPLDDRAWQNYHAYPTRIWDESFFRHPDLILIDGRFRPACFAYACLRVQKPVTVLFDDYVNRPAYSAIERFVKPIRTIGRMAEFRLEPRRYEGATLAFLLQLSTRATFAGQSPDYSQLMAPPRSQPFRHSL